MDWFASAVNAVVGSESDEEQGQPTMISPGAAAADAAAAAGYDSVRVRVLSAQKLLTQGRHRRRSQSQSRSSLGMPRVAGGLSAGRCPGWTSSAKLLPLRRPRRPRTRQSSRSKLARTILSTRTSVTSPSLRP